MNTLTSKSRGIYLFNNNPKTQIYGAVERKQISEIVEINDQIVMGANWRECAEWLATTDVIFSSWGMPELTGEFLSAAPNLKAVFYAAGSIKGFITEEAWDRGICVCSAWALNAIPVAEFNLAQILLATKRVLPTSFAVRAAGRYFERAQVAGNYRSVVGIVSMGMTGRILRRLLEPFDHRVIVYDPFLSDDDAVKLNVELVSLEDLFSLSDVVSLNTPLLPETVGMITGSLLERMKQDATFINTSRGAIVNEPAMIDVLQRRPDLFAVLDVTSPEPPEPGSPLFSLPNVLLTPHMAGSMNNECLRMGQAMVDECRRYLNGQPLEHQVTREMAAKMA